MRNFKSTCHICNKNQPEAGVICNHCESLIKAFGEDANLLKSAAAWLDSRVIDQAPPVAEGKRPTIDVYCDGSAISNGRQFSSSAAAAVLKSEFGNPFIVAEYLPSATSQQAEIVAAAIGLESLDKPHNVRLFSDSAYVVKTMNGAFRRKANMDFWTRLDRAARGHSVTYRWVKGHSGHPLQEAADQAANKTARNGYVDQGLLARIAKSI